MEDDGGNDGDLTTGPLRKRVEDSRWKCRMLAFEELSTTLSQAQPEDKCYEEYSGLWKKIISVSPADHRCAVAGAGLRASGARAGARKFEKQRAPVSMNNRYRTWRRVHGHCAVHDGVARVSVVHQRLRGAPPPNVRVLSASSQPTDKPAAM